MRRFAIVALLAALALGGCGIPDNSSVVQVARGPSTGASSGDAFSPTLPRREDADSRSSLVQNYLSAAAGSLADAPARVKSFLTPAMAASFKPQPIVRVIHLVEQRPLNNPGSDEVSVKGWVVGTLDDNGILQPSADPTVTEYLFRVEEIDGQRGLFLAKAPPLLLLTDEALESYYDLRTIYFWNTERTVLVPDVRYMPRSTPPEQQPTEVLTWLIGGPSPWLAPAVERLPEGTAPIGNVPAVSNDKLQINLNAQAVPTDDKNALDRLGQQLMSSLRPNLPRYLELKLVHQVARVWDQNRFVPDNASYRLSGDPERFVVYDGRIRRLSRSASPADPVPVLLPDANRNVRMAALSSSNNRTYAAVVVADGATTALRVAGVRTGERAALRNVAVPAGALGHPVWAVTPTEPQSGAIGLITVGGRLYSFGAGGGRAHPIPWPGGGRPAISAVAVAPDGQRVALVAGPRLYIAVLVTGGDGVQLAPPVEIRTPVRNPTAVDWSSEGWLVVAGTRVDENRVAIMDITLDGALSTSRLNDLGTEQVSYITAYPTSPLDPRQTSYSVAYVAGGIAYNALTEPTKIGPADLVNPPANPPASAATTAPLFLR
jgi:hypothetical protein